MAWDLYTRKKMSPIGMFHALLWYTTALARMRNEIQSSRKMTTNINA